MSIVWHLHIQWLKSPSRNTLFVIMRELKNIHVIIYLYIYISVAYARSGMKKLL